MKIHHQLIAIAALVSAVISSAAPLTSQSSANTLVFVNGDFVDEQYFSDPNAKVLANSSYAAGGRTLTASASGSLANAQLSAYAQYKALGGTSHGDYLYGGTAIASIRDTFIHSSGGSSPFVWSADDVARFSLDVSGTSTIVDMFGRYDGTDDFLRAGGRIFFTAYDLNGNGFFEYTIGLHPNNDTYLSPLAGWTMVPVDAILSDASETFTVDFTPNGDFTWAITMAIGASSFGGVNSATATADYAHTINVVYTAPDSSTYRSVSGVFGSAATNEIPEPGS